MVKKKEFEEVSAELKRLKVSWFEARRMRRKMEALRGVMLEELDKLEEKMKEK